MSPSVTEMSYTCAPKVVRLFIFCRELPQTNLGVIHSQESGTRTHRYFVERAHNYSNECSEERQRYNDHAILPLSSSKERRMLKREVVSCAGSPIRSEMREDDAVCTDIASESAGHLSSSPPQGTISC
jgi:hypothetical protein